MLHLLYSRFWHKVLFDRGHVPTPEPFQRLVNQGMILGEMSSTPRFKQNGAWISADQVDFDGDAAKHRPDRRNRRAWFSLTEEQVVKKGEGFVLVEQPNIRSRCPGRQDVEEPAATSSIPTTW